MKIRLSRSISIQQRYVLAIMTFIGIALEYMMRNVLSLAITQMTRKIVTEEQVISGEKCPVNNSTWADDDDDESFVEGTYEWSERVQGVILSSFYWGYVITHIPSGMLVEKFGGKLLILFGNASTSLLTVLTPISIYYGGSTFLIILRVVMGLCQGFIYASIYGLLSTWIPLRERTTLGVFVLSGIQFGSIMVMYLSGVILHNIDGWHWPFYIYGFAGALWCFLFAFFCSKDPQSNKFISYEEKNYLAKEIGSLERDKNIATTPYKAIFTSLPVWAIIISQAGTDFTFFINTASLPKYFSDVMRFDVDKNGLYMALSQVLEFLNGICFAFISDFCINKKILSVTNTRRIFTTSGIIGSSIFFILASYSGCNRILAVLFFSLANMIRAIDNSRVNNMDLSPNYAPTIIAIVNCISSTMGILAPIIVGVLTPNSTLSEWRVVFWIGFALLVIPGLFYLIFADGKIQPWNNPKNEDHKETDKDKKNDEKVMAL